MRLRIYHGAAEVGGNCIELEADGKAILLDLGLPLDAPPNMPVVEGLAAADDRLLGVVLSHPHLDHYGLLPEARADLPVWLGEGARKLLTAAAPFTAGAVLPQTVTSYRSREPFEIGPFRITPYLMDHSAYDAHALLIEAGGKRLVYTGDFRGHGRKAKVFERFIADPPKDIDALLMEGTTISRTDARASEADVETEAAELMQSHNGIALACFAGQNIDRCVSFLRAAMKSGRTFVIDAYMASILSAVGMRGLDVVSHPNIRVFLPKAQKRQIVTQQRFDLVEPYKTKRIYRDELLAQPGRFCMMFRASMARDLDGADLAGGLLMYSLWPGYLKRDRTDLRAWARDRGLDFHVVHSSGHAYYPDLKRMVEAVDPKMLIPIHSDQPERFVELFPRVRPAPNGTWVDI